jgi:hypothetical protein
LSGFADELMEKNNCSGLKLKASQKLSGFAAA